MFERYTERARAVLVLSQERTRERNGEFITTEDFLDALIREGGGLAWKVLVAAGITEVVAEPADRPGPGSPPFTPETKKALEYGLREALQLGHSYIGTEHLLLGLLRCGYEDERLSGYGTGRLMDDVMSAMGAPRRVPTGQATDATGETQERKGKPMEFYRCPAKTPLDEGGRVCSLNFKDPHKWGHVARQFSSHGYVEVFAWFDDAGEGVA